MTLLSISNSKCRQCYRCVRECPTNALKIDQRKVRRIESRCVLCGACYKNCPHNAVRIHDGVDKVLELLESGEKAVALLGTSFPAVLDRGTPGQLVTALKKLGFHEVWESACGGDLIVRAYREWFTRHEDGSFISSFCPSLVLYIEKFAPQLVGQLVPIISPMIAAGRMVKRLKGENVKVVSIGSCISRIHERMDKHTDGSVDYALTYHDIPNILEERGIDRIDQEASDFDGPRPSMGGILNITGGMSKCIGFDQDLLNLDFVVEAGSERVKRAIREFQDGVIQSRFLDFLFCKGCIDGPIVDKNISGPSRKHLLVDYIKSRLKGDSSVGDGEEDRWRDINLHRSFSVQDVTMPEPEEAEIRDVLTKLHKTYPKRNLDCGACGYDSCREHAVAVVQGLAEMEMCHHFLLERLRGLYSRLEKSHDELKTSHEKLEQAQRQLIQTEKMASLGHLAAGVAHELNNPLGTITMFARILQKDLAHNEKWKKDIDLIVQEADRAAKIVKDLLSFSRETKVKPGLVNINTLIEEALSLLIKQSLFHNIDVKKKFDQSIPTTFADPDLLKQVILNIVLNGAQAMEGKGVLSLESLAVDDGKAIEVRIGDTGKGIAKEHLHRLFDPFFTTKEKGTGLGLAIAYGSISKHQGKIQVESEVGKGTTFIIRLPVLDQEEWMKSEVVHTEIKEQEGGRVGEVQRQDLIG